MNQSAASLLLSICFLIVMCSSFLGTGTQLAFPFLGTRTQLAFPFLRTRTQLAFPFLGTRTQLPFLFLGTKQECNTPWCHCSSERKCDMLSHLWNGKRNVIPHSREQGMHDYLPISREATVTITAVPVSRFYR